MHTLHMYLCFRWWLQETIYIHICRHMYTLHIYVLCFRVYINMYIDIYTYLYTDIYILYIYTCVASVRGCKRLCIHDTQISNIYVYICFIYMYICTYTIHIYTYKYTYTPPQFVVARDGRDAGGSGVEVMCVD